MTQYTREVTLRDRVFALRLMAPADGGAMLAFAGTVPPIDRLFLRRDIVDPAEIQRWTDDITAGRVVTLLAFEAGAIVGYAYLGFGTDSWTQHRAELRVLVSPGVRRVGLGRLLVGDAMQYGRERGVSVIDAWMTIEQRDARAMFEGFGFSEVAVLPRHVRDREGGAHDLVAMSLGMEEDG